MARKEVVQVRCSELEKQLWRQAAEADNTELSSWIRLTLVKAARSSQARALIHHHPGEPAHQSTSAPINYGTSDLVD